MGGRESVKKNLVLVAITMKIFFIKGCVLVFKVEGLNSKERYQYFKEKTEKLKISLALT